MVSNHGDFASNAVGAGPPAHASLSYLRPEVAQLKRTLDDFVQNDCIPAEREFHAHIASKHGADRWTLDAIPPCLDRLKRKAQALGLWNLFIPPHLLSKVPAGLGPSISLSYREYGILCESLGQCPHIAPEACNTSAPDTGNMEVLLEFGTAAQRAEYLVPLLKGEIRSAFLMTEPAVASSDPTNLETRLVKKLVPVVSSGRNGDGSTVRVEYSLTGTKWWSTGAMDPRCRLALVVAKMDYSDSSLRQYASSSNKDQHPRSKPRSQHGAHTIVAVPLPHPGITMPEALTVFGYDDAPHGHARVVLSDVRLTSSDLILGEGSGFRVSQARLGPGRIHHCMRAIGMASRCYELMLARSLNRHTFGRRLADHGGTHAAVSDSFADLHAARLLTLQCAAAMDTDGVRASRHLIASIKVAVPQLTFQVVDRAVQLFGGAGVTGFLGQTLAGLRTLRIADGPDAVHQRTVARYETRRVETALGGSYSEKKKNSNSSSPVLPSRL